MMVVNLVERLQKNSAALPNRSINDSGPLLSNLDQLAVVVVVGIVVVGVVTASTQRMPVKPDVHSHTGGADVELQLPSFKHGLGVHGVVTLNSQYVPAHKATSQVHDATPLSSVHVPLCWHGLGSQRSAGVVVVVSVM